MLLIQTELMWNMGAWPKKEIDCTYLTVSSSWPLSAAYFKSALITIYNKEK